MDVDAGINKKGGETNKPLSPSISTPNPIRTDNLRFRRPMLYPIELWAQRTIKNTPNPIRTDNLRFRRPMLYPIELWAR